MSPPFFRFFFLVPTFIPMLSAVCTLLLTSLDASFAFLDCAHHHKSETRHAQAQSAGCTHDSHAITADRPAATLR